MTTSEIGTIILGILNTLAVFFLPKVYSLFKQVRDLELNQVKIEGRLKENAMRIEHVNNNVKQGFEFLKEGIEDIKHEMSDIKTEIHELFKRGNS